MSELREPPGLESPGLQSPGLESPGLESPGLESYGGKLDTPLLQRIQDMVRAERWSDFAFLSRRPIPFAAPQKALAESTVALISTGGLHLKGERAFDVMEKPLGDASVRIVPRAAQADQLELEAPYVDAKFTRRDPETALPRRALEALAEQGLIGSAAAEHYSLCGGLLRPYPGLDDTCTRIAERLAEGNVDAVVLIPTCSICVHTISLLAGDLEALGFPTTALSLLPELSQIVGTPRTLRPHFPYGAPVGDPGNSALHRATLAAALGLLETATEPGRVIESPLRWRR